MFLACLALKAVEFTTCFSKLEMQFPSSYWLTGFEDLLGTFLKSGMWPLAAFVKIFMKMHETC
jgi:hypothetical protein